ncbi:MAG: plastocyanin/azurin family copper-binding protein [Flavobacteriales bacterium]
MRRPISLLQFLPLACLGQTIHDVSVGGSTIGGTPPFYSPQHITIQSGDIVRWTNVSGTHNVTGTQSLYPANPQSFSSGSAASGSWTFEFTFTIPGVYNYHCTQFGHAATQFGSVTVLDPGTGIAAVAEAGDELALYPSPARERIFLNAGPMDIRSIRIINLAGEEVMALAAAQAMPMAIDVAALPGGNYFMLLTDMVGRTVAKAFAKQ